MATIHEVARQAQVGVGSVSRYLNGVKVAKATQLKIEDAIKELGFVVNRAARGLARGRIPTIAVLMPFATQPAAFERLRGILEGVRDLQFPVSIFDVEQPEDLPRHLAELCGDLRPEALIVVSLVLTATQREMLEQAGLDPVFVDAYSAQDPSLIIDDTSGGRIATEHLLQLGHTNIAFVGDLENNPLEFNSSRLRRTGFLEAMTAAGVEVPERNIILGLFGRESAAAQIVPVLQRADRPTAVVAASDVQALGVIQGAQQLGISVPGQLSVTGFDDIALAEYAGITTIRQPLIEMSRRAVVLISSQLSGKKIEPVVDLFEVELVERRTTQHLVQ